MNQPYGKRIEEVAYTTKPYDYREKPYGSIETLISNDQFCGKIIRMKKGGRGSLEYHIKKSEYYYILEGLLKVHLRVGRAENYEILVPKGQGFYVPVGLMHGRETIEDTVIFEISTADSDEDSNIVEAAESYEPFTETLGDA